MLREVGSLRGSSRVFAIHTTRGNIARIVQVGNCCADRPSGIADDSRKRGVIIDNVDVGHGVATDKHGDRALVHNEKASADTGRRVNAVKLHASAAEFHVQNALLGDTHESTDTLDLNGSGRLAAGS